MEACTNVLMYYIVYKYIRPSKDNLYNVSVLSAVSDETINQHLQEQKYYNLFLSLHSSKTEHFDNRLL